MKAFVVMFLSLFLLTGCFSESEKDKKDRQYLEDQPVLLPQRIEELKKLCTGYPNLNRTYVLTASGMPKVVMCLYNDVSAGPNQNRIASTYAINAERLEKEENNSK